MDIHFVVDCNAHYQKVGPAFLPLAVDVGRPQGLAWGKTESHECADHRIELHNRSEDTKVRRADMGRTSDCETSFMELDWIRNNKAQCYV